MARDLDMAGEEVSEDVEWDSETVSGGADRKEIARWAILGRRLTAGVAKSVDQEQNKSHLGKSLIISTILIHNKIIHEKTYCNPT